MIEIRQINIRAFPDQSDIVRSTRGHDMKTYIAGTAIKFLMLISDSTADCTITIEDPAKLAVVDAETMTREASGVYSYEYQTPSDDWYTGKWFVTFRATEDESGGLTALTMDKFILTTQNQ